MKLRYCGVRGSTAAPGTEFARTGGHTSCVLVWPTVDAAPSLILDAGTGIRSVTAQLGGAPFRGTILLTHLHWDHLQGLPFFAAGDRDDSDVQLLLPEQGVRPAALLDRAMSPPHFPIDSAGLRGRWVFDTVDEGRQEVEGCTVTAREIDHKGGRTFGYRVERNDVVLAYLPDHLTADQGPRRAAAVELARDADLLIHDAQFVAGEEQVAADYGHATIRAAVELAQEAGAKELALFHHSPSRTDADLDRIAEEWVGVHRGVTVSVAIEGDERDLGSPR